jgi:hypothetical protein
MTTSPLYLFFICFLIACIGKEKYYYIYVTYFSIEKKAVF